MQWSLFVVLLAALIYFYKNEIEVRTIVSKTPVKRSPKVGIVSSWARQGVPYQSRFLSKCLSQAFDVHIFSYKNFVRDEADWGYSKLVYSKVLMPWKVINWIKKEGLKVVFFPDRLEDRSVLEWCRDNKVATVMIINYETIKKEEFDHYRLYAKLLCPVKCTQDLLVSQGFKNTKFIRWGIDNEIFDPVQSELKSPVRFFHNAGYGGAQWRKNTLVVVKAFNMACKKNRNIMLILKTQRPIKEYPERLLNMIEDNGRIRVVEKDLEMNDLIDLYRSCHVSILPSKWEGIGIPFIESLAVGLPVITVDAPPMNEWIKNGYNGLCAKVSKWEARKDRHLLVKGALADANELSRLILRLSDPKAIIRFRANAIRSIKSSKKDFTRHIVKFTRTLCRK